MPKDAEVEAGADKVDAASQAGQGAADAGAGAAADAATLAEGKEGAPPEKDVAPSWPEDWREKLAGGDEKALNKLKRLQSPADVWKSYRGMEQRLSEAKPTLPENPTDEQVAEYRKAAGIPEKAGGYLDGVEGLVIGEDDKPMVDAFLGKMHERNAPPETVREALSWYYDAREKAVTDLHTGDKDFRRSSEDELRAEWGGEYRSNLNTMRGLLDTAPDGLADEILGGRGSSGKLLGDNPAVLKWLTSLASEVNPAATVAPGTGMGQIDSVQSEIAKIEKVMREDRKSYNADTKMQERLRKLYDAEEKLKARA